MSTTTAARSSRRTQASSNPAGPSAPQSRSSAKSNAAAGDRWYINDPATKRLDTSGNPELASQIRELESSALPASVRQSAVAGLRQQQASAKPLTLTIARAQKAGARDLIEVAGDFKSKLLSPSLVAAIAAKPEFVRQFLGEFMASDE
ncbi:hypothetical protein Pan44_53680 [Caulifigura coniformis]|uniref:Uncharacterized protein n=1 Tax=Caulifigura coniformis TaxID=2527983 RepID=A0A517SME6_9PLAN|nr:hypothetical protein [Caulifigura coniformis]QDT57300.1 hypothetical protein Pan44_53680 [Caulifigura coniformis]